MLTTTLETKPTLPPQRNDDYVLRWVLAYLEQYKRPSERIVLLKKTISALIASGTTPTAVTRIP